MGSLKYSIKVDDRRTLPSYRNIAGNNVGLTHVLILYLKETERSITCS